MSLAGRLSARMAVMGISQAELARQVGITQPTIAALLSGKSRSSSHLHKIARALQTSPEFLIGEVEDPNSTPTNARQLYVAQQDALEEQNLVPVQHINLAYGMGESFLNGPVEAVTRYYPRDTLRDYTSAKPEDIFWARGIGDSMFPTISDADMLLIDSSEKTISMQDRVWALAVGDIGMIKRLRVLGETLHICSDNPNVSDFTSTDDEAHIIGRVVAKLGKI